MKLNAFVLARSKSSTEGAAWSDECSIPAIWNRWDSQCCENLEQWEEK